MISQPQAVSHQPVSHAQHAQASAPAISPPSFARVPLPSRAPSREGSQRLHSTVDLPQGLRPSCFFPGTALVFVEICRISRNLYRVTLPGMLFLSLHARSTRVFHLDASSYRSPPMTCICYRHRSYEQTCHSEQHPDPSSDDPLAEGPPRAPGP